jgi:predicted HTH transcriptional regulator
LERLIVDAVLESQHLEFKQKNNPDVFKPNDDDRRNFGKALSGFINATRGILIWGITTKKTAHDEAVPDALAPIAHADKFAQILESLVPNYLSPPNRDIEVRHIPSQRIGNKGFVVVRVGASVHRPHMSTGAAQVLITSQ